MNIPMILQIKNGKEQTKCVAALYAMASPRKICAGGLTVWPPKKN
jgi:hypothetical protein